MARLLRDKDYHKVSLSEAIRELIEDNYSEWLDAEQVGQEEMISKLSQRYIMNQVFTNTTQFDLLAVYKAKNLVEYTEAEWSDLTAYTGFPVYSNTTTYANGDSVIFYGYRYTLNQFGGSTGTDPTNAIWVKGAIAHRVLYKEKIYECISDSQGFIPTNTTYWSYVCNDLTLFYVTVPEDDWDQEVSYIIGDEVFYLDKVYTAARANKNILPDSDTSVWGSGVSYTIPTGTFPDDPLYWTSGDNRNPLIVRYLLDITRYHFERAVPAANISDNIKEMYNGNGVRGLDGAIGWLKRVSSGTDNASLPKIVPTQGLAFDFGNSRKAQDNQPW